MKAIEAIDAELVRMHALAERIGYSGSRAEERIKVLQDQLVSLAHREVERPCASCAVRNVEDPDAACK